MEVPAAVGGTGPAGAASGIALIRGSVPAPAVLGFAHLRTTSCVSTARAPILVLRRTYPSRVDQAGGSTPRRSRNDSAFSAASPRKWLLKNPYTSGTRSLSSRIL